MSLSPAFKMSNKQWRDVLVVLWEAMPETRTHAGNVTQEEMLRMRFKLKLAGFDYRTDQEIVQLMCGAEKMGIINADVAMQCHWRGKHPDDAIDWVMFA